ncbi:hypothetical protein HQ531_11120 [bacterium]|nr:hypothetical protein [bacterium]
MKQLFGFIIVVSCICAQPQDSSYYYVGWDKPGKSVFVPLDSISGSNFTQVTISDGKPVLIKHFDADNVLQNHLENEYDTYGNHYSQRLFDNTGQLREESIFKNDASEMALFRTVFGSTFSPANSNFMIRREYNDFGRESGYFIMGVRGQHICSRTTTYRDDRRKDREILRDDLKGIILTERRYKYIDEENRTVLEEFNAEGKMVQRVVLFDHHDIIQE